MQSYRLSPLADADVRRILAASERQHGTAGRRRYAALMIAAFRRIASEAHLPTAKDRSHLMGSLRSFHLHCVKMPVETRVQNPSHVVYFRPTTRNVIEIVRVLHDRMEPMNWIGRGV